MKNVEAFEMWPYRRILLMSWTYHVTEEEVSHRMAKEREVEYLGRLMSKYRLLLLVIQETIDVKGDRGEEDTQDKNSHVKAHKEPEENERVQSENVSCSN